MKENATFLQKNEYKCVLICFIMNIQNSDILRVYFLKYGVNKYVLDENAIFL